MENGAGGKEEEEGMALVGVTSDRLQQEVLQPLLFYSGRKLRGVVHPYLLPGCLGFSANSPFNLNKSRK